MVTHDGRVSCSRRISTTSLLKRYSFIESPAIEMRRTHGSEILQCRRQSVDISMYIPETIKIMGIDCPNPRIFPSPNPL